MLDFEPEIQSHYQHTLSQLPENVHSLGANCLSIEDVLKAHYSIANHFYLEGHGLGGIGPKDLGLLESAVFRQVASLGGRPKWSAPFDICATLFFGLIKNHAFHDANKRTAFLCALYQLYQQGWCPNVLETEFEDFTVDVADSKLARYARFRELEKSGDPDPEIKFISHYLRKRVRSLDKRDHPITYRQLHTILRRFNFDLGKPDGNFIDIIKYEERRTILGLFGKATVVPVKIGQIGFPRWTAQVSKGDVKKVREMTGLTNANGYDSGAFFGGQDALAPLIATYHAPLMRLANR